MRSSRLLSLSLGLALLLGLGWFGYDRARGPALDRLLLMAVSRNDLRKATELLARGANPNARDERSYSALAWSVHTRNTPMCQLLVEHGAEVVQARSFTGESLFEFAVSLGDPEIVRLFLAKGADPRIPPGQAYGPLHWAAQQGHVPVLKQLLDAGANVDEGRRTALWEAVEHDRAAAAAYLVSRGAKVDRSIQGETPLLRACSQSKWKVAKVLIDAGANVDARDSVGRVSLHWAVRWEDLPTMQALVAGGADIDARDRLGQTALMWASLHGNTPLARWLAAQGADLTLRDARKRNALDLARVCNHPEVLKVLQAAAGRRMMARNSE